MFIIQHLLTILSFPPTSVCADCQIEKLSQAINISHKHTHSHIQPVLSRAPVVLSSAQRYQAHIIRASGTESIFLIFAQWHLTLGEYQRDSTPPHPVATNENKLANKLFGKRIIINLSKFNLFPYMSAYYDCGHKPRWSLLPGPNGTLPKPTTIDRSRVQKPKKI